jgi:hypothetical protein
MLTIRSHRTLHSSLSHFTSSFPFSFAFKAVRRTCEGGRGVLLIATLFDPRLSSWRVLVLSQRFLDMARELYSRSRYFKARAIDRSPGLFALALVEVIQKKRRTDSPSLWGSPTMSCSRAHPTRRATSGISSNTHQCYPDTGGVTS